MAQASERRDASVIVKAAYSLEFESAAPAPIAGTPARVALAEIAMQLGTSANIGTIHVDSGAIHVGDGSLSQSLDDLIEATIRGRKIDSVAVVRAMATATGDPHSYVLSRQVSTGLSLAVNGSPHTELGILGYASTSGGFVLTDVFDGCAGALAGVRPGDELFEINEKRATRTEVRDWFGSPVDKEVRLRHQRGTSRTRIVSCTTPVAGWKMLPGSVGYLRIYISAYSHNETRDSLALSRRALAELKRQQAVAIVLDLRRNRGGGHVNDVPSLFTDADSMFLTRDRHNVDESIPREGDRLVSLPLAVLVDRASFSASEMIAFALQQHGARVFGEPTGGALSFPGHSIRLDDQYTLFHPASLVIDPRTNAPPDGLRVTPDEVVPNPTPKDLRTGRDPQLEAALAWLRRR